jgi:hypothetical protein
MARHELTGDAVEFAAFQDDQGAAGIFGQSRRLPHGFRIQPADQRFSPLVFDQSAGALWFQGPDVERDK